MGKKGKVLSIDYGASSIGLAITDSERMMAFGRGVLKNSATAIVMRKIFDLVEEENISVIVVGLPLSRDGAETSQTTRIRTFGEKLGNYLHERGFKINIDYIDESFSTFEANSLLKEIGVNPRERKKSEDEMAAIILAQRYIDFRA